MPDDVEAHLRAAFEADPSDEATRVALGDLYEARGEALAAETVRAGFLPLDREAAAAYLANLVDTTRRGTVVDTDPRMRPAIASPQVMLWLVLLLDAVAKPERIPALAKLPKKRRSWVVSGLLEARLRTESTLNAVDAVEILGYLDSNYDDLDANCGSPFVGYRKQQHVPQPQLLPRVLRV